MADGGRGGRDYLTLALSRGERGLTSCLLIREWLSRRYERSAKPLPRPAGEAGRAERGRVRVVTTVTEENDQ